MFIATVRGMLAHKLRLVLTTASIAIGVAFLAGSLILTDTMKLAFQQLFGKISSGTDAVVRQEAAYEQSSGIGLTQAPLPAAALEAVEAVDGVRTAEGTVTGYALLTDTDGEAITTGGPPTLGYNMPESKQLRGDVTIRSGRAPEGPDEVAIDVSSASEHEIPLGSSIRVLFRGPSREFTVVGTVGFGNSDDLGGTTAAYFDTDTAVEVLGMPRAFDSIAVVAEPGVSPAQLAARLNELAPPGVEAVTGATVAQESSDALNENVSFFGIMLGIFAGIALFVGSFIIWNTFTMIVSQRSREIALLRAVGATRRQVLRSLVIEALLLGAGASAIGLALGMGVAKGLTWLMTAVGLNLPSTAMQVQARTVIASMVVGTVITVVASFVPSLRATKVLPVEALRESVPGSVAPSRVRTVLGGLITLAGLAALLAGLYAGAGGRLVIGGAVGVLFGVIVLAPVAARPLASAIGAPIGLRGVSGDLARQNAMRNPKRTAATASALMIGLTLVVSMGVFASSLKSSFSGILGESTNADLYLGAASAQAEGYSPEATRIASSVPGVAVVSPTSFGEARINGEPIFYSSVDPRTVERALNLQVSSGSAKDLGTDGVLVKRSVAKDNGWRVGDTVPAEFAETGKQELRIDGIYDRVGGFVESDFVLGIPAQDALGGDRLDSNAIIMLEEGADVGDVHSRLEAALADHPDARVMTQEEFEEVASGFIDQLLAFVTVLLLLAVIVALLGIVNTLALSVFERTRELGLLRAVGATRGQVRAMVRWEAVVISLIGSVSGAVLGVGLGVALAQALKDEGITAISVPVVQVVVYVVLAAAAGVLAALGPARAAARVDVLRAVVTD